MTYPNLRQELEHRKKKSSNRVTLIPTLRRNTRLWRVQKQTELTD